MRWLEQKNPIKDTRDGVNSMTIEDLLRLENEYTEDEKKETTSYLSEIKEAKYEAVTPREVV
eukprot:3116346-Ditylum_brightwellii.AAC.1